MAEEYVWARQKGEQSLAYEAFRQYLNLGKDRSIQGAAEAVNRSYSMVRRWSSTYSWVDRSTAFDSHIAGADTDGLIHQISESRDKNLALMDKLRGLLDQRLDHFIERKEDPTVRWTQAVMAMAKVEANSLLMGQKDKQETTIVRIEELVEKALELQTRAPEEA